MVSMKKFLNAWLPVLLWAGLIFWGSHQQELPKDHVYPLIIVLCRFLHIAPEAAVTITGHFCEYAVFGWLLHRAYRRMGPPRISSLLLAALTGGLYALSDEFHQSFIPGRVASWFDIGTDFLGLITGICLFLYWRRLRESPGKTA